MSAKATDVLVGVAVALVVMSALGYCAVTAALLLKGWVFG